MYVELILSAVLFYVFVPGVLLNLRTPVSSPALTHAVLFALTSGLVLNALRGVVRGVGIRA
jgi:hypothetical protein